MTYSTKKLKIVHNSLNPLLQVNQVLADNRDMIIDYMLGRVLIPYYRSINYYQEQEVDVKANEKS